MRVFFPVIFSMITITVLSLFEIFLLKKMHRDWWRLTWVRQLSYGLPLAGLLGLALWAFGIAADTDLAVNIGAAITTLVLIFGMALMLSLPFSAVFHSIDRFIGWIGRRRAAQNNEFPPDPGRRKLLTTTAAAFPVLAVTAGGTGLLSAYTDPRMPEIPLRYRNLPPALEGFRIMHISDVHVGFFIGFADLERIIELCSAQRPDLVLITGDFCDDAMLYLDALRLAGSIPSRYGAFASIGNHEYFRGIQSIRRSYDRGPIPLLLNSGISVDVNGTSLHIAGADDPRRIGDTGEHFFQHSIEAAMQDAPSDAFTVLMSHRPMGFDRAAEVGISLTLAGHTHGGQIGFNGRSLLYALNPERYMWGRYEQGDSKLYVSAGAGHWFPYRLGCPAEVPIYSLTSG